MNANTAEKWLKILLIGLGVFEIGTATLMVLLPPVYREVFNVPPEVDDYYVRQIGFFLYFFVYFIFLGVRDVRKNLLAVQLVIVFRGIQSVFELVHVLFLLETRDMVFYSMAVFCICNACITAAVIYFLSCMGMPWIDWKKAE